MRRLSVDSEAERRSEAIGRGVVSFSGKANPWVKLFQHRLWTSKSSKSIYDAMVS